MADEKAPDEIRQEIDETRAALATKLSALTDRITETVESAKETVEATTTTVQQTVENTVETVKETVGSTVDTVRETFDLELQVQKRPWLMVGSAVAVGFVLGRMVGGGSAGSVLAGAGGSLGAAASGVGRAAQSGGGFLGDFLGEVVDVSQIKRTGVEAVRGFLTGLAMQAIGPMLSAARDMQSAAAQPSNSYDPYRRPAGVGHSNGF